MRLFIGFLTFLLILTACAPAPSQANPNPDPLKQTTAPPDEAPELLDPILNGTFETSLLATEWKGSQKGHILFPLNPATGTALSGYTPISLGQTFSHAFSPDEQTLAVVSFPNEDAHNGGLLLIDLSTWKTRLFELDLDGWVSTMVFSPDGKRLAVAHGESIYKLTMVDVERGIVAAQSQIDAYVTRMKFTERGEALMLYALAINVPNVPNGTPPQALLLNTADLNLLWSAELENVRDGVFPTGENISQTDLYKPGNAVYLSPATVFAPDRDALYIAHADADQLTTVDFESQKIATVEIQKKLTGFEWLLSLTAGVAHAKIADGTSKQAVISPDGQYLYVVGVRNASVEDQQGNLQMEKIPLGLEIIRTSDGSRVEHIETDMTELSLSPNGRFLYLRDWGDGLSMPWTEIFDTSKQQLIARKEALYGTPALLRNGQFLLVSTSISPEDRYEKQYHMSVLQPSDLSVLSDWIGPEFIYWLPAP